MKYHVKFALLVLSISILAIAGCKKQKCYNCFIYSGVFQYYKNAGPIYSTPGIPNRQWLLDSENLRISQGYTIINVYGSYTPLGTICDTNNTGGPFPTNPDSCVFLYDKY